MIQPFPLVSVIIPVYNSEQFIESTILSAIGQTYVDIEIIIINDGSTDGSLEIIQKYAHLDQRIRVIDKQNEGLVLTRKRGVGEAIGTYIQFLDSDDTLMANAIELLVAKAEATGADIVALPFFFCDSEGTKRASVSLRFTELKGVDYFREILNNRAYWSIWSNFQRRSFLQTVPLKLIPALFFGEDAVWMTQVLLHHPKVVSIEEEVLNYNWNPSSLSNSASILESRHNSFRAFQVWMESYLEKQGLFQSFEKELALQHLETTFTSLEWRQLQHVSEDMKRLWDSIKKFPELKKCLSRRQYKLILFFHVAPFIGRVYLKNCLEKGKNIR